MNAPGLDFYILQDPSKKIEYIEDSKIPNAGKHHSNNQNFITEIPIITFY